MSVLVKGVDMPRRCDECPVRQINLARCQITGKSTSHHPSGQPMNQKSRPSWCPLVEMPDWIPVTERLPAKGQKVLLWMRKQLYPWEGVNYPYDMATYNPDISQPFWGRVIAWMPLPEPYEEA